MKTPRCARATLGAWLTLTLALPLALTACNRQAPPDDRWEAEEIEPTSVERYAAAADYSRDHNGYAFLVYEKGELVYSAYQNGFETTDHSLIYSGTKSFSCALAAAAIEDGILDGYDENVSETLTEWADDPLKSKITVAQMLHFTTGLERSFGVINFGLRPDKYALAVGRAAEHEPGTHYQYDPIHLTTFGAFFGRKSGEDPLDYLDRRVFEPIGLTYADWKRDGAGNPFLARGASLRAEEWARFGLLVKDRGRWEGEQVLDPELLDACFEPGANFPAYGKTWWMNVPIGEEWANHLPNDQVPIDTLAGATANALITTGAPADLVAAAGHKDNRLYISRSADIVVVRLADGDDDFRDADFVELIF